jgi:ATP-dependent Clp protease ATP-binding subunit ClpA
MTWPRRTRRRLLAVIGDDATGVIWQRLRPDGRQVMKAAFQESRELGHPCMADEHVLLGILRHGTSPAADLLREHGLDWATARADLQAVGSTLRPRADPSSALRSVGVDPDQIRRRLEDTFGAHAVRSADRRVRRRPWWRGGHRGPNPLCVYILAKRSLHFAADHAADRGDTHIGPEHLLYGILRDARDPLGTQLSRRTRHQLAPLGWTNGRPNPLTLMLKTHSLDPTQLASRLAAPPT